MNNPEQLVAFSVTLTQAAIEHLVSFNIANEADQAGAAAFMDVMFEKVRELAIRSEKTR